MGEKKMLKKVVWKRNQLIREFLPKLKEVRTNSLENFFLDRMLKNRELHIKLLNKFHFYQSVVNSLLYLAPSLASILMISLLIYESSFNSTVAITIVTLMNRLYSPMKNGANFIHTKINFKIAIKNLNYMINGVQELPKFTESYFLEILLSEEEIISLVKDKEVKNIYNDKEMKKIFELLFEADKLEDEKHLDQDQTIAQTEQLKKKTIISLISKNSLNLNPVLNTTFGENNGKKFNNLMLKKFSIKAGQKVGLIGLQNSGYSDFIRLLVNELVIKENIEELIVRGSVSYLNLESSIFFEGKTLRENIVLSQPFDEQYYYQILKLIELDFKNLSGQDFIQLAENGKNIPTVALRKVLLARFLYLKRDIYIIDRFLDNVSREERDVLDKIFFDTILKEKTVIFASNNSYFLSKTDLSIVFKDSDIVELGPFLQLVSNVDSIASSLCKKSNTRRMGRPRFSSLIKPTIIGQPILKTMNELMSEEEDESYDSDTVSRSLTPKSFLTESDRSQNGLNLEEEDISEEAIIEGKLENKQKANIKKKQTIDLLFEKADAANSKVDATPTTKNNGTNSKFQSTSTITILNKKITYSSPILLQFGRSKRMELRLREKGQIFEKESNKLFSPQYTFYKFLSLGSTSSTYIWMLLFLISSLLFIFGDIWLAIWSRDTLSFSQGYLYPLIYAVVTVLASIFIVLRDTVFRAQFRLLSDKLYQIVLEHLMNLRLDWLNHNSTSKIFTKMTRDQMLIDEEMNTVSLNIFSNLINFLIGLIIINFLYRGILVFFTGILLIYVVNLMRKYSKIVAFLTINQDIKKNDLYQIYLEASRSFPSMRVNGIDNYLIKRFTKTNDLFQNLTSQIFNLSMRWLGVRLTVITTLFQVVNYFLPIILLVCFRSTMSEQAIQLLLAMVWTIKVNNSLVLMIRNLAMCYAKIISVERLFQFVNNGQQEVTNNLRPISNKIEVLEDLNEKSAFELYNIKLPTIDKSSLSMKIHNIKINSKLTAIAGPSVSGRHLLTEVLMGLHFSTLSEDSTILHFGENLRYLNKREIRMKLKYLSNKPYIFIGSVDLNLDPYQKYSLSEKIKVLSYVRILDYFRVVFWSKEDRKRDFNGLKNAYSNIQTKLNSIRNEKLKSDSLELQPEDQGKYKFSLDKKELNCKNSQFLASSGRQDQDEHKRKSKSTKKYNKGFTILKRFNRIAVVKKDDGNEEEILEEENKIKLMNQLLICKELESSQNSRLFRNTSNFQSMGKFGRYELNNASEELFLEAILSNRELMYPLKQLDAFTKLLKIAEIMLEKPRVLFVDENALKIKELPNLDYFQLLTQNLPDTYFIVIVNGRDTLKNFDKVIIMKNGRVNWIGDPQKLPS